MLRNDKFHGFHEIVVITGRTNESNNEIVVITLVHLCQHQTTNTGRGATDRKSLTETGVDKRPERVITGSGNGRKPSTGC